MLGKALKHACAHTHTHPLCCCHTDTCYVLSFAVIMLNTSLHNPNVKDKPSVQRFTAMNRGINDGGDLPEDLLRVRRQHPRDSRVCVCVATNILITTGLLFV